MSDIDLFSDFDHLVDRMFGSREGTRLWYRADIWEDNEHLHVAIEMPGLTPEDVNLSYEDGILRVEGEKKAPERTGEYHLAERRFGKFVRAFQLPNVVDPGSIEATFKDGILTIKLAKRPETKARHIEIKTT